MKDTLVVIFENRKNGFRQDIEIPLYITANELIGSLNEAFGLGIDGKEMEHCFLRTENPITLIRGDKLMREYGLHTATTIYYM